jgi:catechol 2,3-dioxygenase-like lactoylglutathione lyase family enzyme
MTIQRMDHVGVVVDDLAAAKDFFVALGLEVEAEWQVEGDWAGRIIGLEDVHSDVVMLRTPDGHNQLELSKFHTPPAVRAEPESAPSNALGIRHLTILVDDVDAAVATVRAHGGELVGELENYKDIFRLCYAWGPEGIIVELAEKIG